MISRRSRIGLFCVAGLAIGHKVPNIFRKRNKGIVAAHIGHNMPYMAEQLLDKKQLAERLNLKVRGVESLVRARRIPVLRITNKIVRFSWPRVEAALMLHGSNAVVPKIEARTLAPL